MRKENVRTSYLLHLSTTADSKISDQPWVKFQSAGWVNIQSAPTAVDWLYVCESVHPRNQANKPHVAFAWRSNRNDEEVRMERARIK